MQPLQHARNRTVTPQECAADLLMAIPGLMRFIRREMRRSRSAGLSVPQFRALVFLSNVGDASLSELAEHVGLSLSAASRMVQLLVRRGLMERTSHEQDRRRVSLTLTRKGKSTYRLALAATRVALTQTLRNLSPAELTQISTATQMLARVFLSEARLGLIR
jgi:DNA-binding MarR family transcriptional regulator